MNISIYIATQKKIDYKLPSIYKPIFVGADLKEESKKLNYITDNTGDNISKKNPFFCELTALYWAWKNDKSEIIGLAHYRRFLSEKKCGRNINSLLSSSRIEELLSNYDIILPKKSCLYGSVREQYAVGQHISDFDKCGDILKELYPDYYQSFLEVSKKDSIYICNMFVCKKDIIDKYCEWLFNILFKLEEIVDISLYTVAEKRIFGYLSERLFNVWIIHNQLQIYEAKLLKTQEKLKDKLKNYIHLINYKVFRINVLKHQVKRKEKRK